MPNKNVVDDLFKKIDELNVQVTTLQKHKNFINYKAEKWAEKRNIFNSEHERVKNETTDLRIKIDRLSRKLIRLKEKRKEIRTQLQTKNREYENGKAKLQRLLSKTFMRKKEAEQHIKNLEWIIQTNTLTKIDEAKIIEKLKVLELQFLIHKTASKIKKKTVSAKFEIKALKDHDNDLQKEFFEYTIQSEKHHDNIVEKLKEKERIKNKADQVHQDYVKYKRKAQIIHVKYSAMVQQINEISNEAKKLQEKNRKKRETKNMETLSEVAYKKLKDKKKLSFEEFQVLMKNCRI